MSSVPSHASKESKLTYEQAYTQLRETVQALEAGNLSLDDATKLFDKGMRLAKQCNELLAAAELKITRLQRQYGEQMAMVGEAEDDDGAVDEDRR
ncbi:MAG: exodeoxyribonuclease VII small subunit [SAR202 cluster bacterium]|nr:exodeoxyribonuclease VII small subunit [SAR202 cluster bacterium]